MTLRSKVLATFAGYGVALGLLLSAVIVHSYFLVEDRLLNQFLSQGIDHSNRALAMHDTPALMPGFTFYPDGASAPAQLRRLEPGVHEVRQYVHVAVVAHPSGGAPYYLVLDESASGFGDILRRILTLALIVLIVSSLLGIIIGGALSRHFLAPLDTLVERVNNVDPAVPSLESLGRTDEFGLLSDRFSELIERLRAFSQREQDFTRFASHELRSPITVIRGSASILRQTDTLSAPGQRAATRIVAATERMSRLVEAFLHLGRDSATLASERLSADDVLADMRLLAEQRADAGTPVKLEIVRCCGHVETDRLLLSIALENLIANAAQHGEGSLTVDLALPRLSLTNAIANDGQHGHGFGLEIARKMCGRLGASLNVSQSGGVFTASLRLPVPGSDAGK